MSKIQYEVKRRLRIYQNLMRASDEINAAYQNMTVQDDPTIEEEVVEEEAVEEEAVEEEAVEEEVVEEEVATGGVIEILDPIPDATDATTFIITGDMVDAVVTTMGDSYSDGWNGSVEAKIMNINTGEVYAILTGPEMGSSSEDINFLLPQGEYGVYMDGSAYEWTVENSIIIFTAGMTLLEIPQGSFPAVPGLYYGQISESEGEGEGESDGGEGESDGGE